MSVQDAAGVDLVAAVTAPGAGSAVAAGREVAGPLGPATTPQPLPWDPGAPAAVTLGPCRYPAVLITLLADLDDTQLVVVPAVPGATLVPLTFATWTEAGSSLVAWVPPADDQGASAGGRLTLTAHRAGADGSSSALTDDEIRAGLRLDLVTGVAGRVLVTLLDEKARTRRTARQLAGLRTTALAQGNALDRLGADLGCPRFTDELVWDPDRRSPGTRPLPAGQREDDAAYRARLRTLHGWRLPTPLWADAALNGAPDAAVPGMLADVGVTTPVAVDEAPGSVHLALRLLTPGSRRGRATLLSAVRGVHLVWPAGSPDGDAAHGARLLPQVVVDRVAATRGALARWHLPDHQPLAPALATALEVLDGRCTLLGARPWPAVLAGQQDGGGSRLELGLGAVLAPPDPAALDAAVTAATALHDPALVPVPRADDPIGAWLLAACGLRTAEPMANGDIFVSTLAMGPLVIDVAPGPDAGLPLTVTASLLSAADASHDAPLVRVVAAMAARGLTPGDPAPLVAGARSAPDAIVTALGGLGVPAVVEPAGFARQLAAVSTRLYAAFDLGVAGTAAITTDPTRLEAALAAAAAAGASSAVAVVTATDTVAVLLAVTGLPLAGSNLAARQTVLYRWQTRGLSGDPVLMQPVHGPATRVLAPGDGITVVSCLASVRGQGNDPYEWNPSVADGQLLTLRQYEHLMNLVELVTPVGVRANTWRLRQQHIDVDGSGRPTPLTSAAARAYRRYRSR